MRSLRAQLQQIHRDHAHIGHDTHECATFARACAHLLINAERAVLNAHHEARFAEGAATPGQAGAPDAPGAAPQPRPVPPGQEETVLDLLALHVHTPVVENCTCTRAACGAAIHGPATPGTGCSACPDVPLRHLAVTCPALPEGTDLSRVWLLSLRTVPAGHVPVIGQVTRYSRARLRALCDAGVRWDLALGDAVRSWQARREAMNAEYRASGTP